MISIKNLDIRTNTLLVENMNATFELNNIIGLSAPNGSGKTTLFKTICGLRSEIKGSIKIIQEDLEKKDIKKQIFFFESSNWFNPNLTGKDYLMLINTQWSGDKRLINESINIWNMNGFINTKIKTYSLGMRQKLLLSLYYVSDTKYWILDEPTLALDKDSVEVLENFLLSQKSLGKCIIFSAHEDDQFYKICDEKYTIEYGVFKKI